MSDEPIVELLRDECRRVAALGAGLADAQWSTMTECPGWDVHDVVADLVGTESWLVGEPVPETEPPVADRSYIRNELGERNEVWVEALRPLSPGALLERFRTVTARRAAELEAMSPDDFARVGPSPVGEVPYREYMEIRLLDLWVHEQDIRRVVGDAGHHVGPIADRVIQRIATAMPFVVAKKAGAPDGTVVFDLTGDAARTVAVVVDGGRGRLHDDRPPAPAVTLAMDTETWWCLALGRWGPAAVLADGLVTVAGDHALGDRIVASMAFMV